MFQIKLKPLVHVFIIVFVIGNVFFGNLKTGDLLINNQCIENQNMLPSCVLMVFSLTMMMSCP